MAVKIANNRATQPDTAPAATDAMPSSVQQALDQIVADSLPNVSLWAGLVYMLLAMAHFFMLPTAVSRIMIPTALITAVLLLGLRYQLYRQPPLSHSAHPIAATILIFFASNSLLHLYLTNEPRQTTNILLVVMGTGLFLLSRRWFLTVQAATTGGWLLVALLLPRTTEWLHFAIALALALIVSTITFRMRQKALSRFVHLRHQDEKRQDELEYRALQLETSMALGKHITSILNMNDLLNEAVELLHIKYNLRFVAVFLLDDTGDQLDMRAGSGREGALLCYEKFTLAVDNETLIGAVAKNGRSLWLNDTNQPAEHAHLNIGTTARAELALPLQVSGVRLGVLDLQSEQVNAFTATDVHFMEMLADQIAIAVYNAYVYQGEQSTRLLTEKMYMTGRALAGTLDWFDLLERVLDNLSHVVSSQRTAILLKTNGTLHMVAHRGFPAAASPDDIEIPVNEGEGESIYGWIYRRKRPLAIPDAIHHPDWHHVDALTPTRAWLGVPLIQTDEVIGILSLARETPQSYTDEEIRLATAFAEQAATALHNANLYEKLTQFNQRLEKQVKRRTIDLREAIDRLEKLDRTKSEFISVAAHELRTPLTLLRGYSQMLLRDQAIAANSYHRELVTNIQAGEARLESVVNAMVDMAKIDNRSLDLYPEPVAIDEILHKVIAGLRHSLKERQQQIILTQIEPLPAIEGDPDALAKVFYHLVVNAIKYTPDGGSITILGKPIYAVNGVGDYIHRVEIVIQDSGIGIDPAYHELIFTKFYQTGEAAFHSTGQTKFKGGGPGLGLPIARGIVEAHQGKIWVESAGYNEDTFPGSKFHIVLPVKQPRDAAS